MSETYLDELRRKWEEGERYVNEHYTEEYIAQRAREVGWDPEAYREWLIRMHGKLLIPCNTRGRMK